MEDDSSQRIQKHGVSVSRSANCVQFLQRANFNQLRIDTRSQRLNQRMRARHSRYARQVVLQSGAPDRLLVVVRSSPEWRVDNERNLALLYVIDDVGPAFVDFENVRYFQSDFSQARRGAEGGHQLESQAIKFSRQHDCLAFVRFVDADKI